MDDEVANGEPKAICNGWGLKELGNTLLGALGHKYAISEGVWKGGENNGCCV